MASEIGDREGVDWTSIGFSQAEARELDDLPPPPGQFHLRKQLAIWQQWVRELDSGALWVREDWDSACDSRDDVERTVLELPVKYRARLFAFLDELDLTFRQRTVSAAGASNADPQQWWRTRVPLRNEQRLFLFGE